MHHSPNSFLLKYYLSQQPFFQSPPVFLCIGSDRMIGDCLGPLVGTMLQKRSCHTLTVYGTLEKPVHALNLMETEHFIRKKHAARTLVAIDASLGRIEHIGSVFIHGKGLRPGAGVKKILPETGDISITGITNEESADPYLDLQTARLSTVVSVSEKICECILNCCFF